MLDWITECTALITLLALAAVTPFEARIVQSHLVLPGKRKHVRQSVDWKGNLKFMLW